MIKKALVFKRFFIAVVLLSVLATCISGGVLAKYIFKNSDTTLADPESFYFSCNYDDGGIYYLPGTSANVQISNFDGLGHTNITDIAATITYFKINTSGETIGELTTKNVAFAANTPQTNEEVTITAAKGERYKVTVETVAPYQQTITFTLIFMEKDAETFYSVTKNGTWLQLDLYIGSEIPDGVTIQYGDLAPDNTNPLMTDWVDANANTIPKASLHDHAHYTLIFFGAELGTGKSGDLSISENTISLS